ncbi:MAG: CheR family methyltransferase, partial [Planctomycetota bacterium]
MPVDSGMAFVVVQHLSPDFESMMDELLARHTKMEIHKVVDRIDVKPNAVYLIPAEKNMSLSDGKLLLTDQDKKRALNLPIDIFFDSLAANAGERSAAVVLSGSGSDGSRGVTKIHNAGGVVLVQEPETAAFDSMPKASIRTGICDAVASPAELALKLASFNRTNSKTQLVKEIQATVPNPDDGPESAIFHILRLFRIHFEVDFALYKPATITRRIDRRVQMGGFKTLMAYAEYLEESREELNLLFRDLLVEVTEFFRDEAAFRILRTTVIPNLVENKPDNGEIRVWVPGCATGEEAYSIAMLIDEAISKSGRKIEFRVFATDVHRSSLETASLAVYPANSTTRIPSELSQKYFTQNNDLCHIKRDLRQKVIFAANDLTSDPPFTRIDLISCRNVLIYLESKIQKRIISFFHFGLTVGGTLFLGPSETVGDLAPEFETVDRHWRIYSKRRDIRLPEAARLPVVPAISSLVHDRTAGVASGAKAAMHPWLTSAYEDLLAKHVPPSLLINQFGELLHSFGAARNFLVQPEGRSTLDAIKLLPDSLRTVVSAGLHRAKSDDKPVVFHSV